MQIKKLNSFIRTIAKGKVIKLSLASFILVMLMVNVIFKQDFDYLTQTLFYTPEYMYQLLSDIGPTGRSTHLFVLLPDILMVLLYTVILLGVNYSIYNVLLKNCIFISFIVFLPLTLSLTQIIEIVLLGILLLQYPSEFFLLAQITNIFTMTKMILTVIMFSIPFIGLGILSIKKIRGRITVD